MKIHYVYLTTNLINGKQYVGDHTINDKEKKYYIGSGNIFKKAIKKYGEENFFKEILEWFKTREEAFNAQEKYIKQFDTLVSSGYNISPKGGHRGKESVSEDSKIKMSNSKKGNKNPQYHIKKELAAFYGKKHSLEIKNKLSKSHKGIITWNKNLKLSNKIKLKISKSLIGFKHTTESKEKMSNSKKGDKHHFYNKTLQKQKCIYCGKEVDFMNLHRWHMENCKFKNI
jgi:group I intron endonuclease